MSDSSNLKVNHRAVMEDIYAIHQLQLVHLDYLTIKFSEGKKDVHMLIITDHL